MTQKKIRSGITEISVTLFLQWLREEFSTYSDNPLTVKLLRNASDLRSFRAATGEQRPSDTDNVQGQRGDSVAFPRAHATLGRFALNPDKGGYKKSVASGGIQTGRNTHLGEAYFETMRPVLLDIGVSFQTDNLDEVLAYGTMLFEVAPKLTLNARDDESGFNVQIGVGIEGELTIPPADTSAPGDPFVMETVFTLSTYTGIVSTQRLIRKIRVSSYARSDSMPTQTFELDSFTKVMADTLNYYDLYNRNSPFYKGDYKE